MQPYRNNYPFDLFPTFWENLDVLIGEGRLFSVRACYDEIVYQEDELADWAKQRRHIFWEHTEALQQELKEVLSQVPTLYEAHTDRSGGDPYIVALARFKNAVLVSDEQRSRKKKDLTIHQACDKLNIQSMRVVEFMRKEQWRF
ncbi:hypothetical protein Lepto7376_3691 [[Leptolyngbya] sp. PCC 7376]|nr:hypothetical protein Lepto7376_3691 [[Leptolyngbya] sp. PCC 7376]